jgi:hypothetical protein
MMPAFYIIYTVKDAKGKTATTEIKIPTTFNITNIVNFAGAMAILINTLIKGQIIAISIVATINMSSIISIRSAPLADSDVEEKASFGFSTDAGFDTGLMLPTFNEDFLVSGTRDVDLTDAAVIDFTEAMLLGISTAPGPVVTTPSDAHGDDLDLFRFGYEVFMASGRRKA